MDLTLKYYCKKCDEKGELSIDVKGSYQFEELYQPEIPDTLIIELFKGN